MTAAPADPRPWCWRPLALVLALCLVTAGCIEGQKPTPQQRTLPERPDTAPPTPPHGGARHVRPPPPPKK
jgi:hypothetical protein